MATKTIIHINQHVIRKNRKSDPSNILTPLAIKNGRKNTYGYAVDIEGPARVIYRPEKPLACGATCWVETKSEVKIQLSRAGD